jgi:uncharacterized membrane protein YqjE
MHNKKQLIIEVLFAIIVAALVGFGLFCLIYVIAIFPLGFQDGMRFAVYGGLATATLLGAYKIRFILRDYKKQS